MSVLNYYFDTFVEGLRKTTANFRMSLAPRSPDSTICIVATLRNGSLRKRGSTLSRDKTFISYPQRPYRLWGPIYFLFSG